MEKEHGQTAGSQFKEDVKTGLTSYPKTLNSKYFYDREGDRLFQEIMALPEYYLTDLEFNILEKHKKDIAAAFSSKEGFDLIELGAGDGKKTKILLKQLLEEQQDFIYLPVDISQNVLDQLSSSLQQELPNLRVEAQRGTYTETLERLEKYNSRKKVILFLGSNLGNMLPEQAIQFLKKIGSTMGPEDLLFIGLDQKKHPQVILDAYNDSAGVTAAFNLNLLSRINRELSADFDPDNFLHWPVYNPETGTAKSYLVSKKAHTVKINSLNLEVSFDAWESIHTEISQKYDGPSINNLSKEAGMEIVKSFADSEGKFRDYIFKKN